MHYKGRPNNYLFRLFLTLLRRPEKKTVAISQMFNHVQLHVSECIYYILGYAGIPAFI